MELNEKETISYFGGYQTAIMSFAIMLMEKEEDLAKVHLPLDKSAILKCYSTLRDAILTQQRQVEEERKNGTPTGSLQ